MLKRKFAVLIFLFSYQVSFSQFINIKIDDAGNPEEPSITVNPKNTGNIVAGANINFVYQSLDGGNTWEKSELSSPYGVWGDPCIFTDTAGNFYYIHLSYPPEDSGVWIDRIVCQKSVDAGATWTSGTYTGLNGVSAQDKAWAAVDPQTNTIYVTWTQFDHYGSSDPNDSSTILFSKSADGALTWSAPVRISRLGGDCLDSDNTTEGAVPCVGPNGEIYVAWSNRDTLFFDRSLDGGTTWLNNDVVVADQPGGWDYFISGLFRCNGLPITKCDLSSSAYHGTIYVNWTDQRNGVDNTDVWLSKSINGGVTWSAPLKVNDDELNKQQFLTWMDVDQETGNIYILFYDRRNYSDASTDVYLAYSSDGGTTFSNQKISSDPFVPNETAFFGDYTNISAYAGKIAPIWTRQDGSSTSVWTALIDFATLTGETPDFKAAHFLLYQNYPNPFSDATKIEMDIQESGNYSLSLYDLTGKKITELLPDTYLHKGTQTITLDALQLHLSEGSYYVSLKKGDVLQTKKLVFVQ